LQEVLSQGLADLPAVHVKCTSMNQGIECIELVEKSGRATCHDLLQEIDIIGRAEAAKQRFADGGDIRLKVLRACYGRGRGQNT
jgi:hypothetical protein